LPAAVGDAFVAATHGRNSVDQDSVPS